MRIRTFRNLLPLHSYLLTGVCLAIFQGAAVQADTQPSTPHFGASCSTPGAVATESVDIENFVGPVELEEGCPQTGYHKVICNSTYRKIREYSMKCTCVNGVCTWQDTGCGQYRTGAKCFQSYRANCGTPLCPDKTGKEVYQPPPYNEYSSVCERRTARPGATGAATSPDLSIESSLDIRQVLRDRNHRIVPSSLKNHIKRELSRNSRSIGARAVTAGALRREARKAQALLRKAGWLIGNTRETHALPPAECVLEQ